jgi:hypothetical protein
LDDSAFSKHKCKLDYWTYQLELYLKDLSRHFLKDLC